MENNLYMVFDVEAIGLHGEGFAVGYVVVDVSTGQEEDSGLYQTNPDNASGTRADYEWVRANVVPALKATLPQRWGDGLGSSSVREVRERFWDKWTYWKFQKALLAADVPWPVEARFLLACIDDDRRIDRGSLGPYPLIDVASARMAAGFDPLATEERHEYELPVHNPLADARQSARLLLEALLSPPPLDR